MDMNLLYPVVTITFLVGYALGLGIGLLLGSGNRKEKDE